MEFRKEKSEKSKKIIQKHFTSDIFNIKSGYYKSEKILPVSSKPNEPRQSKKEFIPKYPELKHYERHFNNLISQHQKYNTNIMDFKPNHSYKNAELEVVRNRSKEIKNNCYDQNGNFSAKKLYIHDFFGKENLNITNNINNKSINKSNIDRSRSKSIKEKRKERNIIRNKKKNNSLDINNKIHLDKIHNLKYNYNNKYYNNNYNTNINTLKNDLFTNYLKESKKIKNWIINPENDSYKINNNNISNKINNNTLNKTEYLQQGKKSEKKFFVHPKNLSKVFSMDTNIKLKKIDKRGNDDGQEFFYIEIKNFEFNHNSPLVDEKKVKEIISKNGLHVFDFNTDGMNGLFIEKKIKAKLRKNKDDENFEKNYRKFVKELKKYNLQVDKCEMIDGKGFQNQSKKKRKGTPGNALRKNLDKLDKKTELNTAIYLK